jgi:NAD(P)-dependent dehydrogenase (short-subunit alcohol dehydrogenase family)
MLFDLAGKKLLIVGGSYGMGLATAEAAVDLGAEVAIASRGAEKLEAAAAVLESRGNRPVPYKAFRIEDRAAVRAFMEEQAPFDHLVLPGSTVKPIRYADLDEASAREAVESKFWGPFWACFDARPHIRAGGSIVLYSGVAAVRPVKGYLMGASINGAINALTRSLALEFGAQGVRVNTIAPGLTDTPLNDILHAHDKEERYRAMAARLPVKRIGTAAEAAQAAIYLMCNGFVTAQVLGVDGGQQVMD